MIMNLDSYDRAPAELNEECSSFIKDFLADRALIIASNRGPVTFYEDDSGTLIHQRRSGGLVTALTGAAQYAEVQWVACAETEEEKAWGGGLAPSNNGSENIHMQFISPSPAAYDGYYRVISNPLLWFLQHSMWDIFREPTIDRNVWQSWEEGYVSVNMQFAEAIARQVAASSKRPLVLLQDYHLYLAAAFIRYKFRPRARYTLAHFIHIPWPGAEDWGFLPAKMRRAILEGLCAADLLGFQTREDALNFLRTCESFLPRAHASFNHGRIWYRNHTTYVRDFPISIDVKSLRILSETDEVGDYRNQLLEQYRGQQVILRIDRIEPSKNIVRGFQAFEELLELHPEHRGKVNFLALLVPSRMGLEQYGNYLDEIMGHAGRVNAKYGETEWEPIRILIGENYSRAVAAMQIYNVLLVNSIADGMNLVAKEGPAVNRYDGALVLSERTGAFQQLEPGAIVVSPLDIYGTAEALHQALTMPAEERKARAERLRGMVERHDIADWLCQQFETILKLNL